MTKEARHSMYYMLTLLAKFGVCRPDESFGPNGIIFSYDDCNYYIDSLERIWNEKPDKKILRRSFWGALGKLIGVMMAAGAGSLLYQIVGGTNGLSIGLASVLAISGFLLMWFAEYEKENEV